MWVRAPGRGEGAEKGLLLAEAQQPEIPICILRDCCLVPSGWYIKKELAGDLTQKVGSARPSKTAYQAGGET